MKTQVQKWIYYLSYTEELPENFFKLSRELSKLGYMLLPIKPDQVYLFVLDHMIPHIVTITGSMQEHQLWSKAMHRKLNYFVMNKKIHLYHLSSFKKAAYINQRNEHYHFMHLPCKTNLLALKLVEFHEKNKPESKVWPGGRRAKLPA